MLEEFQNWEKLGLILKPESQVPWLASHSGACCIESIENNKVSILITGRDTNNRSQIGRGLLDLQSLEIELQNDPVLTQGDLGAFDENGVSYPFLVDDYLFFTGWMPTVLTPFKNNLGVARKVGQRYERVSKAPILPLDNDDYLGIGSACSFRENGRFKLWYTSFQGWGSKEDSLKHKYLIKYAESDDCLNWKRENVECIIPKNSDEHSIARPCVLKIEGNYHMWYCYRGDQYKIGYAYSKNGRDWKRRDEKLGLNLGPSEFDSVSVTYPCVFEIGRYLYMIYAGNDYGDGGLGIARMEIR